MTRRRLFLRGRLSRSLAALIVLPTTSVWAQFNSPSAATAPPGITAESDPAMEPAVRAVAQVLPSVVKIATERVVPQRVSDPFEDLFNPFFNDDRNAGSGRVLRRKVSSLGSGFLVSSDGLIVTNEHVVERAAEMKIQVTFSDGVAFPARYVTGNRSKDLSLIKIERTHGGPAFPYLNLARLSPNLLGQTVLVLGNPLGYSSSAGRGILSANNREITVEDVAYQGSIQTDAAIYPGNSGGPLIDLAGRLIGVSSVKASFTPQGIPTQGLGFAIPGQAVAAWILTVKEAVFVALSSGGVSSGGDTSVKARELFGLTMGEDQVPRLRGGTEGAEYVVISGLEGGSPADDAGLRPGMVLFKIGTYGIPNLTRWESLLADVPAGTAADFVVGPGPGFLGNKSTIVTILARGAPGA